MKRSRSLLAVATTLFLVWCFALIGCKQEVTGQTGTEEEVEKQLADAVRSAFGNSLVFKLPDVKVALFKGRLQFSGFVRNDDQKSAAEAIAKGIHGIGEVDKKISLET